MLLMLEVDEEPLEVETEDWTEEPEETEVGEDTHDWGEFSFRVPTDFWGKSAYGCIVIAAAA
jgi:hypothetical protein